jgi:hypothetical protein
VSAVVVGGGLAEAGALLLEPLAAEAGGRAAAPSAMIRDA